MLTCVDLNVLRSDSLTNTVWQVVTCGGVMHALLGDICSTQNQQMDCGAHPINPGAGEMPRRGKTILFKVLHLIVWSLLA